MVAQSLGTAENRIEWRRIGNSAIASDLPSLATGSVERVWFSPDGLRLFALTRGGRVLESSDFEKWQPSASPKAPPEAAAIPPATLPESGARVRRVSDSRFYAVGTNAWRSDDGGRHWNNLTAYRQESILGSPLQDLAVSPDDPDDVIVAGRSGIWRSLDGGKSWTGLNQSLPNLPVRKLLRLPAGSRGLRVEAEGWGELEWAPGERTAWRPVSGATTERQEAGIRQALSRILDARITSFALAGDIVYAGSSDGRIWFSTDRGQNWAVPFTAGGTRVEAIFADAREPGIALAALSGGIETGGARPPRIVRTMNGGFFWDDATANLPDASARGVTADVVSGAVYAATDAGIFMTLTNLTSAGAPTSWMPAGQDLPSAPVTDVRLDGAGNQLFAAVDGYGVYVATAPHRLRQARVVNSADLTSRPAAPGSLLSVLGSRVQSARMGELDVPVLDASDTESQIQVPFEVQGPSVSLALEASGGRMTFGVPVQDVSPVIFLINPDGTPMVSDADSGVLVDAMNPAGAGARLHILATGLGRVTPAWPSGLAAPMDSPPRVVAPLRVFLDGRPLEVKRATLAPGYIGFYLMEVQLPEIVNSGPAELYIEAEGQPGNRVRIYLAQ